MSFKAHVVSLIHRIDFCILGLKSGDLTPHIVRNDAHVVSSVNFGFQTVVSLEGHNLFIRAPF